MSRNILLGFAWLLVFAPSIHAEDAPEKLLSPTAQVYIRWDGVTAHSDAYKGSAIGSVMAGPTGDAIRSLLAKGPKLLGASLLVEPLLDGKPPQELKAVHADLKSAEKVLDLILDKGMILAAEVNQPRPTIKGVGKALGGLLRGESLEPDAFYPEPHLFIIIPNVADKAEVLFGSFRLLIRQTETHVLPLPTNLDCKGFAIVSTVDGSSTQTAWWMEGKHFVFYAGSSPVEIAVKGLRENAAKGGLLNHPLYRRCLKTEQFESVARGFVDTGALVNLAKFLAGPFVPGLSEKLDAIGIGNLEAIVFSSGFNGKESRAVYEFDLPGKRKGLARIVKAKSVTLADLPPLPPDVSRFSMLRVDPSGAYDAALVALDAFAAGESFGVEDQAKTPQEAARLRKEYLEREYNRLLGINFKEDLLPHLGDKFVIYQTPVEGFSALGTVCCLSVKDGAKVQAALDRLQGLTASPVKIRRKMLRGVEIREIYSRAFLFFTPTYTVSGDWLVIALHPQPVQGFVLRQKGDLERWKPDAATTARFAKMPTDAIGIQFCNPKSTVHNLCSVGPVLFNALALGDFFDDDSEFNPLDVGLIPNGYELGKHLFPNLTYTRDDGKTIRIEVNDSFSLPLEFLGFEALPFALGLGVAGFAF